MLFVKTPRVYLMLCFPFSFRRPLLHFGFIYFLIPAGRTFKKDCDFVHTVAEEIIEKRKEYLVGEWFRFKFYLFVPLYKWKEYSFCASGKSCGLCSVDPSLSFCCM